MGTVERYLASFDTLAAPAGEPEAISQVRKTAMERFAALGVPTTRLEAWRFTNVAPLADRDFVLAPAAPGGTPSSEVRASASAAAAGTPGAVFLNGRYMPGLSDTSGLPPGTIVGSLSDVRRTHPALLEPHLTRHAGIDDHAFVALNTAFMTDGAVVLIPDGAVVESPIGITFLTDANGTPTVSHPRTLVIAGANSQAAVVESYAATTAASYFTNAVTEIVAGQGAQIEHYRLQAESEHALHVGAVVARQARDSNVTYHAVSLGGAMVRNDVQVTLDGTGADCVLSGLYLTHGRQHVDNDTTIDHVSPHSTSRETYKGVLDDASRAVFSGRIIVRRDAQKVVARQTNKNLLLSEHAVVNTKPQLQINADDVKCFHGATVGMLDEDAVFYLRSRGLDPDAARSLLVHAFVSDLVALMKVARVRDHLGGMIRRRLGVCDDFRGEA
jgi:Fe-S cluster assembly protein SufD